MRGSSTTCGSSCSTTCSACRIAFFTRTQTGALISRMNNDVIGAQRAVTGTLGSVVSNVVVLATTLTAMIILEWRITHRGPGPAADLHHPGQAGRARKMQAITRESFDLNSTMNTQMTERFNVSGAHAGEAVRQLRGRGRRVRRPRRPGARHRRARARCTAAPSSSPSAWSGRSAPPPSTASAATWSSPAPSSWARWWPWPPSSPGSTTRSPRLTNARVDIMTAFVSFDRVFEILDLTNAIDDRPGAVDLVDPDGRIEIDDVWFRYPAAAGVSLASLEADPGRPLSDEAGDAVLHGVTAVIEPGQLVALVGPSGAGKTTLELAHPPPLRRHLGGDPGRRPRRARPHPAVAPRRHRRGQPGPAPVPRVGHGQPALRPPRRHRRRGRRRVPGRPDPRRDRRRCPTATTPSSASAATASRAARSSAWPSPACC